MLKRQGLGCRVGGSVWQEEGIERTSHRRDWHRGTGTARCWRSAPHDAALQRPEGGEEDWSGGALLGEGLRVRECGGSEG